MTSPEALYVTCYRLQSVVIPTQKAVSVGDSRTEYLDLTSHHEMPEFGSDRVRGIGETLADARWAAGLTLEDVGASTRIRLERLIEFENDDYSGCGPTVFVRGRLRTLARAVGLDPAPLLAAFDAAHEPPDSAERASSRGKFVALSSRWLLLVVGLLGVVLLYLVVLMIAWVLGGT
jgi:cytoskeletal protein RodZ